VKYDQEPTSVPLPGLPGKFDPWSGTAPGSHVDWHPVAPADPRTILTGAPGVGVVGPAAISDSGSAVSPNVPSQSFMFAPGGVETFTRVPLDSDQPPASGNGSRLVNHFSHPNGRGEPRE
jgi:hypothetical protein